MKKNTAIILICHSFLVYPSNSWPRPGGLGAECVQVSVMYIRPWGLQGAGSEDPQGPKSYKLCCKLFFGLNVTVVIYILIGTYLILLS